MVRLSLLLMTLVIAGCVARAQIVVERGANLPGTNWPVFVGTSRSSNDGRGFGAVRHYQPRFARFDINVPPEREVGEVSWPEDSVDPNRQFLATAARQYGDAVEFRTDLRAALSKLPRGKRDAFVFVHGFNNTFAEGVLRMAQMANDFALTGAAVHYSWPSAGKALGYVHDIDSALFARDGLELLIAEVEAAGADHIILVGHSMGSLLIMETLRQLAIAKPGSVERRIAGVILISPDIDVELFRAQVARIGTLPRTFGIFISRRDRALSLSRRITGSTNRLGNVANANSVSDLDVTLVDVTEFSRGLGHFTVGTSPTLIKIFASAGQIDAAFSGDNAGRIGLVDGAVLTVQNATEIILKPAAALATASGN